MGLFDGATGHGELASTAQVAKLLRGAGGAGGRRLGAGPLGGGAGARVRVLRPGGAAGRGDPQQGRLAAARGDPAGGAGGGRACRCWARCAGTTSSGVPARHLGLVPVAERRAEALAWVAAVAERVRADCDLDALLALARTAPPLPGEPWDPARPRWRRGPAAGGPRRRHGRRSPVPGGRRDRRRRLRPPPRVRRPVVAVARGAAFTFAYPEHVELLAAAGAEVVGLRPAAPTRRCRPARRGWSSAAASPRSTGPSCRENGALRRQVAAFRRPGGRRVRRTALPGTGVGRPPDVRGAGREGRDERAPHARLPGGGRAGRQRARGRRDPGARARVPPHPGGAVRRTGTRRGAWCGRSAVPRASSRAGCTPPTCTCTGPPNRRSRAASWTPARGGSRHDAAPACA